MFPLARKRNFSPCVNGVFDPKGVSEVRDQERGGLLRRISTQEPTYFSVVYWRARGRLLIQCEEMNPNLHRPQSLVQGCFSQKVVSGLVAVATDFDSC